MKNLIRNFLRRFGYDIIKTAKWYKPKANIEKKIKVGNWYITMPGNNPLFRTYELYPDFNSIIGRLATIIAKKYPGMTVVDVGANVGDTIAIVKSAVDLPVIGIEGDDISFKFLEKNTKQFPDVNIRKTFLGEKKGDIKANLKRSGWNTTVVPSEEGVQTVSFKTLDEVLGEELLKKAEIKLIKVDVEGFDTIVLRGSYAVIKKHHPVLFFEYNRDSMKAINEDGLPTLLSLNDYGYNRIAFFDYKGRLLLATLMKNREEITYLHNYAIGDNNLLSFYDICIFHEQDGAIVTEFLKGEEKYSAEHS